MSFGNWHAGAAPDHAMMLQIVSLQEMEYIDPMTLKPDLYAAAVANNTQKVVDYLKMEVPGTFIDTATGWTVIDEFVALRVCQKTYGAFLYSLFIGPLCMAMCPWQGRSLQGECVDALSEFGRGSKIFYRRYAGEQVSLITG
jgi:hypothetical protein